ncbi:MAG: DoxX family membrane protein [Candidatus Liptonbacteria bacterium]|nr:DoxX family membrane protein [Candidatus Liptonbacteria bacterium]
MEGYQKITLFALRIALGWLFFYAGISKLFNPTWTSEGYLRGAKTLASFYAWLAQPGILPFIDFAWLAQPGILPFIDFVNEWGLTLLGISLILGLFVGISSRLGAFLMLLYYFPVLEFPYVAHGFIVDDHIIYALALLYLASVRAGRTWGFDEWCTKLPLCQRYPALRQFFG